MKVTNKELARKTDTIFTVNNRWERLWNGMIKRAKNTIGKVKTKRIKKPRVTEAMLSKMDEWRKWKNFNTEQGKRK